MPRTAINPYNAACRYGADKLTTNAHFRLVERVSGLRDGPDGVVDVHLYTKDSRHPAIVVQCKAWRSGAVGVAVARDGGRLLDANVPQLGDRDADGNATVPPNAARA